MTDMFEMSMMEELKFFLGFQIKQLEDGMFISQTKYTHNLLKKFGMDKTKPIKTSMGTNGHLDLDMGGKSIDQKVYHFMIAFLIYLYSSRLDIMLSVCMCTRFQAAPKECHLRTIKRNLRYLILTPYLGLWNSKGAHFELISYSDADYARYKWIERAHPRLVNFLVGL
jgi:hypothetical protein